MIADNGDRSAITKITRYSEREEERIGDILWSETAGTCRGRDTALRAHLAEYLYQPEP